MSLPDTDRSNMRLSRRRVEAGMQEVSKNIAKLEESIEKRAKFAINAAKQLSLRLINIENMPEWAKDNELIIRYYRNPTPSYYSAFRSMFFLHNEFFNIWTHLLGSILVIFMSNHALMKLDDNSFHGERTAWIVFTISALFCLGTSTAYHLLRHHSEEIYRLTTVLDYIGIATLIFGSFFSALYYLFFCEPFYFKLYSSIITILCLITAYAVTNPKFDLPEYRLMRFATFFSTCFFVFIPYSQIFFYIWSGRRPWSNLYSFIIIECVFYLVGGVVFSSRFPENFTSIPGKFDVFFSSHQLWHLFVLAGVISHFSAIYVGLDERGSLECTSSMSMTTM